ncbi:peroxiredoxin [Oceanidesulfovibrio marinus]|uniref:Alkyl hydroperoxide reductase C n=1 Tax=Oceanidesulfovibrio marinus TaxID=370038 RepID=A0A6P1ZEE0_9BACT|nr:peroxiredoxin [Oceanidesulfovibrio marinus]QJT08518.1 peroxiredoxin [Oceanidesulfovibrio marinus]TVM33014.1 peroxiredoxin [Oceanidesulfovibrio marinus]
MSCDTGYHHDHPHFHPVEHAVIGKPVKDFTMEVFDPEEGGFGEVSLEALKDQKKWVILFFYPADFTFVCPTELADLAAKHSELKAKNCEVLSVSTDTKFTHLAWKNDEVLLKDVKYKMAADHTGVVSRYFGVYDCESGVAQRGTFIINPEGILVGTEITFQNVGRNADELVRKLDASIYLQDHPAEACPAKWTPGEKTLTPSEKLVGKVGEELK